MGLISNTIMLGVGLCAGYVLWHPTPESCNEMYGRKIAAIEEKYSSTPRNEVLGPRDVSIDYVVDEKTGINGLVITHNRSGKSGTLVERPILFQESYRLDIEPLDKPLHPQEIISLTGIRGEKQVNPKEELSDKLTNKLKDYAIKVTR